MKLKLDREKSETWWERDANPIWVFYLLPDIRAEQEVRWNKNEKNQIDESNGDKEEK